MFELVRIKIPESFGKSISRTIRQGLRRTCQLKSWCWKRGSTEIAFQPIVLTNEVILDDSEKAFTADREKESNDENSKPSDEVITELDTDKKTLISRDYSS